MDFLERELERLRAEAERALRDGDLARASEIQYGQIVDIERLREGSRFSIVHESSRHMVLEDEHGVWIAKRLGDSLESRDVPPSPEPPALGWMKVDVALTLRERKQLILKQVRDALERGDYIGAGRLETGALRVVERALRLGRCFTFVSAEGGRTLLRDDHGQLHVLIPIENA